MRTRWLALMIGTMAAGQLHAAEPPTPKPFSLQVRYRHEMVDDAAFAKDAQADTLRLRAGWNGQFGHGFTSLIEVEGVAELGNQFNSGANRQVTYPVVQDARATELNQAWLDWRGQQVGVRLGRQRILLDNQRFVGNVGWRQNEQTFDAVNLQWKPLKNLDLQAIWLGRVHRVAGDNAIDPLARQRRLDGRLLHADYKLPAGSLTGYGYWIEDKDVPSASSRTLGLRWNGAWALSKRSRFGFAAEAARQNGWATARVGSADYLLVEPRLEHGPLTFKLGYEKLSAGTPRTFQTPFATLHAFNGWADKFLVTPVDGLQDRYAGIAGTFAASARKGRWELAWHDYQSDRNTRAYGKELDASFAFGIAKGWDALLKVADYRADGFARDTRKGWVQVGYSY